MSTKDYTPLHLIAAEAKDVELISASLQDAVLKISDMAYLPGDHRFAFVANRFLWELVGERKRGPFARVRTGVHFDDVVSVKQRNLRLDRGDGVVDLLAIRLSRGDDDGSENSNADIVTELVFAGGGSVLIRSQAIAMELHDLSEPWITRNRPDHDAATQAENGAKTSEESAR